MDKRYKKHGEGRIYLIAITFSSISATTITLLSHDLLQAYPTVEIGVVTALFLSVFFISHRLHQTQQKESGNLLQEKSTDQPTVETVRNREKDIDRLIDLSRQLKRRLDIKKHHDLINTIYDSALTLKEETEVSASQSTAPKTLPSDITKKGSARDGKITKDWKLEDARTLLLTSDTSDRHQISQHLSGWQIQVKICSNTVRTFTEILSASDNNNPYHIVIVDQRQLDMEAVQFANSIRSEPSLQNLSLIYLGPENSDYRNQQLTTAGYSILQTPINKPLLYNTLHASANASQHHSSHNIASFINHYTRDQSPLPPLDILIAASQANLKRIQNILKSTKHQAFTVENGEQALNAMDSHNFDLAIFELDMPIMNGIEAIKLYHFTHQNNPGMPFILFTPESDLQVIRECNELNIDACIIGKIQHHTLLAAIKQAMLDHNKQRYTKKSEQIITAENYSQTEATQYNSTLLGRATLRDLEELGSGREFVHNLINSFLLNSEELLNGMEKAVAENNHQSFINYALAFKDSAGNLGALAVYKASIKASHLEAADFKTNAGTLINEIRVSFNNTRKALLDYMAEHDNTMHNHQPQT